MSGSKKRYDSKYKVTRIFLADYIMLKELSKKAGLSMAETLHRLIVDQVIPEQVTVISRTQLRMIPAITSIAVNGNKAAALANKAPVALANKPKGVKYE